MLDRPGGTHLGDSQGASVWLTGGGSSTAAVGLLDPVDSLLFGQMPHARVPSWYDMLQISEIGALTSWCSFTFHFHV